MDGSGSQGPVRFEFAGVGQPQQNLLLGKKMGVASSPSAPLPFAQPCTFAVRKAGSGSVRLLTGSAKARAPTLASPFCSLSLAAITVASPAPSSAKPKPKR